MPDIKVIRIVIKGDDKDLDRSEKRIGAFGGNVQRVAGAMKATGAALTAGITMPLLGVATASVKTAAQFDQSLRNIDSLAKLSSAGFKGLHDDILALANDPKIRQMPDDLAKGMYDIYGSGFKGAKAIDILRQAAYGASAGMTTTATASKVLVAALNSGIKGATDAKTTMNILFREVDIGVNSFEELASSIGKVLPTAKLAGVSLQEVSAAIATMTKQGLSSAESVTSLNNLLVKIARPTEGAKKVFDELGLSYGLNALEAKGLGGWLDELNAKVGNNKQKMLELIPELRGMRGELLLATDNSKMYKDAMAQMASANEGAGASASSLERQNKGLVAQFEILRKEATLAGMELAESLMPTLRDLISMARDGIKWFGGLPDPIKAVGVAVGITAAAIGPLLSGLADMKMLSLALSLQSGGLAVTATKITLLGEAALAARAAIMGPVGLVAALAVLAAAKYSFDVNQLAAKVEANAAMPFFKTAEAKVREIRSAIAALESEAERKAKLRNPGADTGYMASMGSLLDPSEQAKRAHLQRELAEWERRAGQARQTAEDFSRKAAQSAAALAKANTPGAPPPGTGGGTNPLVEEAKKQLESYLDTVAALKRELRVLRDGGTQNMAQLTAQYKHLSNAQLHNLDNLQNEVQIIKTTQDARKNLSEQIADVTARIKDFKTVGRDAFSAFWASMPEGASKLQSKQLYDLKQDLEAMTKLRQIQIDQLASIHKGETQAKIDQLESAIKLNGGTESIWKQVTSLKELGIEYKTLSKTVQTELDKLATKLFAENTTKEIAKLTTEGMKAMLKNHSAELRGMKGEFPVLPGIDIGLSPRNSKGAHDDLPSGILDGATSARLKKQVADMKLSDALLPETQMMITLERVRKQFASTFADIFSSALDNGGDFFKDMEKGFASLLRRMAAQATASYVTSQLFGLVAAGGSAATGGLGGLILSSALSVFGGRREHGGPVHPGRAYIVGERGPEWFTPGQSGRIIPNGAGGSVHVTNQVYGDVNNLGGLQDLMDEITDAVQSGLRYG